MTSCSLCDLPTPNPPITDPDVDGEYCCPGCLAAASTLGSIDEDPEPSSEATGSSAYLKIDGMHCATCETFLQRRATAQVGINAANASAPSGLMQVTYDPDKIERSDIPSLLEGTGYRAWLAETEAPETGDDTVARLVVGGFFAMMVMAWYVLFLYPVYFGVDESLQLFSLSGQAGTYLLGNLWLLSTIVLGYTGWPILRGGWVSLRAKSPNMDLLVTIAAGTAYLYSSLAMALGHIEVYFDVAVIIVMAVTLGRYYEEHIRTRALGTLSALAEQRVETARIKTDNGVRDIDRGDLTGGETVLVKQHETIPVDGTVIDGEGTVDESLLTGESRPVEKTVGDKVIGGTKLLAGGVSFSVAEDATSTMDRLVSVLWDVRTRRPGIQQLADRLAAVFVPVVLTLGLLAVAVHLGLGAGLVPAILTGLAVLVVSCPCALGIATPLATAAGVQCGLDRNIVITNDSVFEQAETIDTIAFDKTGTLTTGNMEVLDVEGPEQTLDMAATLEAYADHPIAAAIVGAGEADGVVDSVTVHTGAGVTGTINEMDVIVGSVDLFDERGWAIPASMRQESAERAETIVYVGWDGKARGRITVGDRPRPEWERVLDSLGTDHDIVVITGDSLAATQTFQDHSAVTEVFTGVPPDGKAAIIAELASENTVAMVGEGSNDGPALARADIGIALQSESALAMDAADVVITNDELQTVPTVFELTAATNRRIRQNIGWAFCYNVIALPLAIAGLINPLLAGVAMASSSLLVVGNSTRSLLKE